MRCNDMIDGRGEISHASVSLFLGAQLPMKFGSLCLIRSPMFESNFGDLKAGQY